MNITTCETVAAVKTSTLSIYERKILKKQGESTNM